MEWSVIAPESHPKDSEGRTKVYDVECKRPAKRTHAGQYSLLFLVRIDYETGAEERIHLGAIMPTSGRSSTPNWWAMGYFPGYLTADEVPVGKVIDGSAVESVRGFSTKRYAIEHILTRTGWYKD